MPIHNFGSVCSGIEAASFTLQPMGVNALWLSEIADFPSRFLDVQYPEHPNLGDMNEIPDKVLAEEIPSPDLLVGGTPCQAFSLAGWRNGVNDERGQLTLKYIDIIDAIDTKRLEQNLDRALFFWENVEGALTDKTNAFGCFLAGLAGIEDPVQVGKFKSAGVLHGPKRSIAWRVLDAKYFGVPQQRKRVYVLGGGVNFHPEHILFEMGNRFQDPYKIRDTNKQPIQSLFPEEDTEPEVNQDIIKPLRREINGHDIEVFRCYSDCLYAAYGTKWNGNAAAFNGSLFVSQNGRLRRLTPIECERLMGFPDNYTAIANPRLTNRYQATGNSWAVPVIRWIMNRLLETTNNGNNHQVELPKPYIQDEVYTLYQFDDFTPVAGQFLNASNSCYDFVLSNMLDIIDTDPDEKLYISKAGCAGILRRKREHNAGMNARLEVVLENCSK
jgi:DNA (cytosine-5)-methyltransferase 1